VNRQKLRQALARARFGAVALCLVLMSVTAFAAGELSQPPGEEDRQVIHDRCVALARDKPQEALEKAKIWRAEGGGFAADHCIAMALFEMKDYRGAAERFETLAADMMAMPAKQRANALDQAGQSWLDANDPARAKTNFDAALALDGDDADMLIDRAEALAALHDYHGAVDDLTHVLKIAPKRAEAYIYRGAAYRALDRMDLALQDVERGVRLDPKNPSGFLERGNIKLIKGDVAGARADWQRVVKLAPNSPASMAAKTNLGNLSADSGKPPRSDSPQR